MEGVVGFTHVKLPVTDLARSVRWYADLLDMQLAMEFVEGGELRGAELVEPVSGVRIALRDRAFCASRPVLAGFDPFGLEVDAVGSLHRVSGATVSGSGTAAFASFPAVRRSTSRTRTAPSFACTSRRGARRSSVSSSWATPSAPTTRRV